MGQDLPEPGLFAAKPALDPPAAQSPRMCSGVSSTRP